MVLRACSEYGQSHSGFVCKRLLKNYANEVALQPAGPVVDASRRRRRQN